MLIMLNTNPIIDIIMPAVAMPVDAPAFLAFILPITPRTRPVIAVANPKNNHQPTVNVTIPKTMDAIDIPLPGYSIGPGSGG